MKMKLWVLTFLLLVFSILLVSTSYLLLINKQRNVSPQVTNEEPDELKINYISIDGAYCDARAEKCIIPRSVGLPLDTTCIWTYSGGNATIPYKQTTSFPHTIDYYGFFYDMKINCVDEAGALYLGTVDTESHKSTQAPLLEREAIPSTYSFDLNIDELGYDLPYYTAICRPETKITCSSEGCELIEPKVFVLYDSTTKSLYRCDNKPCDKYDVVEYSGGIYKYIRPIGNKELLVKIADSEFAPILAPEHANKYVEVVTTGLTTLISYGSCN